MGEREVEGRQCRVLIQPRTEYVHGRSNDPNYTQVELEAVVPLDQNVIVSETEEIFHGGNSKSLGRVEVHFGLEPTHENYEAVNDLYELLREVGMACASSEDRR